MYGNLFGAAHIGRTNAVPRYGMSEYLESGIEKTFDLVMPFLLQKLIVSLVEEVNEPPDSRLQGHEDSRKLLSTFFSFKEEPPWQS